MSTKLEMKDYATVVRERHSVRHYDAAATISREELKEMLAEASLAPSSSNTQMWRFLVIDDPEAKQTLLPIANNQKQVVEAAATIAVLGDLNGYRELGRINDMAVKAGYMPEDFAKQFTENAVKLYAALPPERLRNIVQTDGGLVSMQLMLSAKARGYDTVPMGGFNPEKLIEAFSIPDHLVPIMLIAVGKAATPGRLTVRLPIDDITSWNDMKKG
ncbi:nitroreductase family protein [Cohnella zeiphila]|uniref:Nitroreductase family protein n=1 Tax=Cohnella zeiphila TaxID=2761120 RepID=A0A7X0SRA6_9BACL|nr:nitroreductase family protein [Cohnella zeiphila]MBB6734614.1 nitroreductase family protein [Cohnella zeiphila]